MSEEKLDLARGRGFQKESNGPGWPATRLAFDAWLSRNGAALLDHIDALKTEVEQLKADRDAIGPPFHAWR